VGFDPRRYRLGYGGGFFDRTLAGLGGKPLTVGIGFSQQAIETIRPHEHDIPMNLIVTEEGRREAR
ncbi:MAG: 5-formyltetrahydrofolate cyclo-ligase, partial [Flavobacteriaceae bacterium]